MCKRIEKAVESMNQALMQYTECLMIGNNPALQHPRIHSCLDRTAGDDIHMNSSSCGLVRKRLVIDEHAIHGQKHSCFRVRTS